MIDASARQASYPLPILASLKVQTSLEGSFQRVALLPHTALNSHLMVALRGTELPGTICRFEFSCAAGHFHRSISLVSGCWNSVRVPAADAGPTASPSQQNTNLRDSSGPHLEVDINK